jgi:dihydrolipoamide dehydrogenase
VLRTTAELVEKLERAEEFGVDIPGDVRPSMKRLQERKRTVVDNQAKGILKLFRHHRIRYLEGRGILQGADRVFVRHPDESTAEVLHDRLILALGSQPSEIPSLPFDRKRILSSNDALEVRDIPASMLIVGGGVVGCEFAFIFASLGSRVTVIEAMPRLLPLPSIDEDCSKTLQREMKKRGISFMVSRVIDHVEDGGENLRARIVPSPFLKEPTEKERKPMIVDAEKILVCVGRKPNTERIGLEECGVRPNGRGWIPVDERMQTGVSDIYAIGDVLGPEKIMLAHVASSEGVVAAENAMGESRTMDYGVVPSAIFTTPEIACAGWTEEQARTEGYSVRSDSVLFRNLGKAQVMGEIAGQAKIVSDEQTGRILGVHLMGPHATDLIAEGVLAIQGGHTLEELSETIHAHPTLAEIMVEVSLKGLGRPLHG